MLSAAGHLPATAVLAMAVGSDEHTEPPAQDGTRVVTGAEEHTQPPGTGPPILI